ncbi:zinc-ribbon domain-containing protein [Lachnospiraceae bacterium OttesenSCG-928-E19]|nr:zinc-ribbon domain-containing protein [Lachnospiraceae bacterium OttesenSCG-928-E19]
MKEKIMRFMYGRYGMDSLNKFIVGLGFVLVLLTMFINHSVLWYIGMALILYAYYRMFSKNHPKRYAENQAYLKHTYKIRGFFSKQKSRLKQLKTHHIYRCPSCKQKIRVPRGKGKIEVRCPKCNTTFIKRS